MEEVGFGTTGVVAESAVALAAAFTVCLADETGFAVVAEPGTTGLVEDTDDVAGTLVVAVAVFEMGVMRDELVAFAALLLDPGALSETIRIRGAGATFDAVTELLPLPLPLPLLLLVVLLVAAVEVTARAGAAGSVFTLLSGLLPVAVEVEVAGTGTLGFSFSDENDDGLGVVP